MPMKRMTLILLLFLLSVTPVFAAEPDIAARGAALIDGKTGRLLWSRNAEEPMTMASTTKIMTAILVLENCEMDEIVTISKNAAHQPEVHMDLQEGERWKAGDLLSAMMLRSCNDAAVALAEHISGLLRTIRHTIRSNLLPCTLTTCWTKQPTTVCACCLCLWWGKMCKNYHY